MQGIVLKQLKKRDDHISKFYGELHKKRLDTLISIEDFLANGQNRNGNYEGKKLTDRECESLEMVITLDELTTALNKSKMNSACGWEGISYWLIKKILGVHWTSFNKMCK